jgi:MFS family permease
LACAIGVSTIYFNQPLLVEMGKTYAAPASRVMLVSGATQVGYAFGLLLFVPLGDLLERRALMTRMYIAVIVALLMVSLAPTLWWLIAGSVVLGLVASVTHIVLPIAPDMVSDKQRGRAIGKVMMGLLLGILLARSFAGWVSRIPALFVYAPRLFPKGAFWVTDGWRYVFVIAALVNAAFLWLLGRAMPKLPPKQDLRYADAMRSLWTLLCTQPLLRESSVIGALIFASFSCFWTTLAFLLSSHYGLGAGIAGRQARDAMGADRRNDSACALLCAAVGSGEVQPLIYAAHCGSGDWRNRAGYRRATGAGVQPDAHLWTGSLGAQSSEHGLYDDLLHRRSGWLVAVYGGLGALEMERRLRTGVGDDRSGWSLARARTTRSGALQPRVAERTRGRLSAGNLDLL